MVASDASRSVIVERSNTVAGRLLSQTSFFRDSSGKQSGPDRNPDKIAAKASVSRRKTVTELVRCPPKWHGGSPYWRGYWLDETVSRLGLGICVGFARRGQRARIRAGCTAHVASFKTVQPAPLHHPSRPSASLRRPSRSLRRGTGNPQISRSPSSGAPRCRRIGSHHPQRKPPRQAPPLLRALHRLLFRYRIRG